MKLLLLLLCLAGLAAGAPRPKTLDVHLVDVEGGKALLMVTPAGESLLIDVGWPASNNREASTDRLVDAVKAAGLEQIDYLVISHYDLDHMGDVPALVARVKVGRLVDHGSYTGTNMATQQRYDTYSRLYETIPHIVVKPGDRIPIQGVEALVVTAGGEMIAKPVKGAGAANALCAANPRKAELLSDKEDNSSIGLLFTYGKFRMLDLADLEAFKNHDLVCPSNLIGTVEVYQANVHAQFKGMSPELIGAVHPRVAMVGNGARKGGDPESWPVLRGTPGLEDIWQVHYSANGGRDNNPPDDYIANLEPSVPVVDQWKTLKLSVSSDGSFTVTNGRNGFSKTYEARQ